MSNLKIGEKIKTKRKERDLTQEDIAKILGVTKAAVSKWENAESYPDVTILPQIAQLFHITMDELFNYTLDYQPLKIINQYSFGLSLNNIDKAVLNHGTVKECKLVKTASTAVTPGENTWDVRICIQSTEEDFPHTIQKYIKSGILVDGYSVRLADGRVIDDDKPNKHFICKEKVWEYKNTDRQYLQRMLKEQVAMGLIEEDEM